MVMRGDVYLVRDMLKRFSFRAKKTIGCALDAAGELGHTYIGSEHLLMGLADEESGAVSRMLRERGCEKPKVRERIIGMTGMGCRTSLTAEDMTPVFRRIILRASYIASASGAAKVGPEHLAIAMLGEDCVAVRILESLKIDTVELISLLESVYCSEMYDEPSQYSEPESFDASEPEPRVKSVPTPLLDANSTDLTLRAAEGKTDPVIGRENEEERIISILMRRTKNNPCLIGEAGVGKTAIVESVAMRIAKGRVPEPLKNKRILSLELSSLVAGTKYRGEFEEKVKGILDEARSSPDVILFIDEIHTVVGAGGAEGAIDASNILKPSLARGEIRLIGATTLREYKSSIEKDKALERRFQTVTVREPDVASCKMMLLGIRPEYEKYHGVTITDGAVDSAIELSSRYLTERFLPDKAIDLIDEAAASCRTAQNGKTAFTVGAAEIASAVERHTGIPVKVLTEGESARLSGLEEELKAQIIGQDEAVAALASAVKRARLGVRPDRRPGGSFMFLGSAGVGKTECAKVLAKTVFGGQGSLLRLDMTEFSEPHSVSKLIGAPAGYVGYGEGGLLTERIRRDPYTLVLFDEIEKAHPDVRALILQILDEGVLTDSSGIRVPFSDSIVIATANVPARSAAIGFGEGVRGGRDTAKDFLAPELVDRFDEIIVFRDLEKSDLRRIAAQKLGSFAEKLKERGIILRFDQSAADSLVESSGSRSARAVSRYVLRKAGDVVAGAMLDGSLREGCEAVLWFDGEPELKIMQKSY